MQETCDLKYLCAFQLLWYTDGAEKFREVLGNQ